MHTAANDSRLYREVTFLVGLAELAKAGLIQFVTSAELQAESLRQPLGRFRGYGYDDLSLFEGLSIPSLDGYRFDPTETLAAQQKRLSSSAVEPFKMISSALPTNNGLDAWHIHTAHRHNAFCFLAIDFPLIENFRAAQKKGAIPNLDSKPMLPSELGKLIRLTPIPTYLVSFRNVKWYARPDLHLPEGRRTSPRKKMVKTDASESERNMMTDKDKKPFVAGLPPVGKMLGLRMSYGPDAVGIQYNGRKEDLYQLDMSLGDALYLLSLLKGLQLNLDIPFPDDPRDPNAKPIRPSDRLKS